MPLHFVYRNYDQAPNCKFFCTRDYVNLLDWAVTQAPPGFEEVRDINVIARVVFPRAEIKVTSDTIQVRESNDGEVNLIYIFTDDFHQRRPDLTEYLLTPEGQLPLKTKAANKAFRPTTESARLLPTKNGNGSIYVVLLNDATTHEHVVNSFRIEGLRMADLPRYLFTELPAGFEIWKGRDFSQWPSPLNLLRAAIMLRPRKFLKGEEPFWESLIGDPQDRDNWAVYSDWLLDRGLNSAAHTIWERGLKRITELPYSEILELIFADWPCGSREDALKVWNKATVNFRDRRKRDRKSVFHIGGHITQIVRYGDNDQFSQWIFFDDLWSAYHPNLANSLLCYANRWDVLTE